MSDIDAEALERMLPSIEDESDYQRYLESDKEAPVGSKDGPESDEGGQKRDGLAGEFSSTDEEVSVERIIAQVMNNISDPENSKDINKWGENYLSTHSSPLSGKEH